MYSFFILYYKIEQTLFESRELSVEKLVSLKAACQLDLDVSLKRPVVSFTKIGYGGLNSYMGTSMSKNNYYLLDVAKVVYSNCSLLVSEF
jgi:hypothetical protein